MSPSFHFHCVISLKAAQNIFTLAYIHTPTQKHAHTHTETPPKPQIPSFPTDPDHYNNGKSMSVVMPTLPWPLASVFQQMHPLSSTSSFLFFFLKKGEGGTLTTLHNVSPLIIWHNKSQWVCVCALGDRAVRTVGKQLGTEWKEPWQE